MSVPWVEDENSVPRISDDLDNLDAGVFSGELLYTNLNEFEWYVARWQRAIDKQKKINPVCDCGYDTCSDCACNSNFSHGLDG